jgi:predicted enzyme related to lactoylglutathione lyase
MQIMLHPLIELLLLIFIFTNASQAIGLMMSWSCSRNHRIQRFQMSDLGFIRVKGIALAVTDLERANRFYGETLALPPDTIRNMESAYLIGDTIVMLKTEEEIQAKPTEELNPRITVETDDSFATEKALKERGVTVSDPVTLYDDTPIGAFLDSEGNKIWFCSVAGKSDID